MDGMNELAIAYILQGVLKALDYIHHMGYVHRCIGASSPFTGVAVCAHEPPSKHWKVDLS